MHKETIHISDRTLAIRFNGVFSPTDRGHLAHELVRTHMLLKKSEDPQVMFKMNDEGKYRTREEELCGLLGLPSDKKAREKIIQGYSGYLARVGLPYYKINLK